MAIADTITSMQNHTSNAYTMIGYGTDLTGINKNLENLSSTIFEAFLEALRNPDTLFTNLPKTSGSGSNITLNNTAYAPMRITLNPTALSQETTLGSNLVDFLNPTNVTQGSYDSTTKVYTSNALTGNWKGLNIYVNATPISLPTGNSTFYYSADIRLKSGTYANNISVMRTGTNLTDVTSSVTGTTNPTISSSFQRYVFKVDYVNSNESEVTYVNHYLQLKSNADNAVLEVKNIMVSKTNTDYEIYTYGASPNPSYPQDIHTISGNNSVVVEGKNLFDGEIENGGINTTTGANVSDNSLRRSKNYIKVQPNTTYIFSNNGSGVAMNIIEYTSTKDFSNYHLTSSNSSFTTSNLTYYIRFYRGTTNIDKVQLEKGTTATTYTPYVSQTAPINLGDIEYCKIGDYEDKFIRNSGKNLFNGDIEVGGIIDSDGSNNNTVTGSLRSTNYIPVNSSTQYTLSNNKNYHIRVYEYSENKTYIQMIDTLFQSSATFTTTSTTKYIRFRTIQSGNENDLSSLWQLELGNQATEYQPYGTNEWYIKKNIGKIMLDGSDDEGWLMSITSRFYITLNRLTGNTLGLCNYFENKSSLSTDNSITFYQTNQNIYIYYDGCTTTSDFKTWLSTHNTIVYYILATPTYTKITGELASQLESVYKGMLSYDGTTNISQVNNDLAFVINASALQDLS